MAEESPIKMMPTDEVVDAKIKAALEEPLRTLQEHGETLASKADGNNVYDKTTVDSKVKTVADAVAEHVANNTRHIADSERETWNNKPDSSEIYTRQQSDQRFSNVSHEHTNDGWFISAINAVKALIPTLPSWLTPTREEPPTKKEVGSKYTKPSGGIPLSDLEPSTFPPESHSHASDGWFTTAINSKADEAKPSFSTITINGVDYTEWTLGTRSGKIMLSVDMGGTSTEIAAFNPVTGVFVSAPSQYRNTLRFDGEAPVVGVSPTLFDHVARESALDGKLDNSHNTDSSAHNDIRTALSGKRDYDDRSWGDLVSGVKANGDYSIIMEERDGAHYYRKIPDSIGSDSFAEFRLFLSEATGDEQGELWVYQVRHFINGGSEMDLDVSSVSNGGFIENTITVTGEAGNVTFVKGYYRIDSFALTSNIAEHNESSSAHSDIRTELNSKANVSDFSPTNPAPYVSGVIDARLPYPLYAVPSNGLLKNRAINTTSLASVTVPDDFTDLLIRASVASSLAVTMPNAITKYGDTFPAAAGEYLVTITKTGTAEAYVRVIKLEVAQ